MNLIRQARLPGLETKEYVPMKIEMTQLIPIANSNFLGSAARAEQRFKPRITEPRNGKYPGSPCSIRTHPRPSAAIRADS